MQCAQRDVKVAQMASGSWSPWRSTGVLLSVERRPESCVYKVCLHAGVLMKRESRQPWTESACELRSAGLSLGAPKADHIPDTSAALEFTLVVHTSYFESQHIYFDSVFPPKCICDRDAPSRRYWSTETRSDVASPQTASSVKAPAASATTTTATNRTKHCLDNTQPRLSHCNNEKCSVCKDLFFPSKNPVLATSFSGFLSIRAIGVPGLSQHGLNLRHLTSPGTGDTGQQTTARHTPRLHHCALSLKVPAPTLRCLSIASTYQER
jgi:hypothetical protein